jgi:hypothetical protein
MDVSDKLEGIELNLFIGDQCGNSHNNIEYEVASNDS